MKSLNPQSLIQAFDNILPGHDIPELLDESFQRRKVLFVGKRGTAVRHHHHFEVQHHGVATGGLAADIGLGASNQDRIDAIVAQH